ncbi:MAG TPA: CvpA family protein [Deltaproteobacteria bacterium]|nr:CvpA family protein [Deltaproteobacteria bacterium]HQB37879.1 CvpA family protein [Deltaproteobacteria bacterium]
MNLFDIVILVVLICFALKGFLRGLVNEVSSLAGLVLGGWAAYLYYPSVASLIHNWLHLSRQVSSFLAFMLLMFLIAIIAHIIGNIVTAALRVVMLGTLNRLGGLLLGAAEGVLLLSLLLFVAKSEFMPEPFKQKIAESKPASMLASAGAQIVNLCRSKTDIRK